MENAISGLTTAVTPSVLWGSFANVVPFIAVIIPFSLGLYLTKRVLQGTTRGKVKIA